MRNILIICCCLLAGSLSAQSAAAPERVVVQMSTSEYFQQSLERLYLSFEAGEADQINTLQNQLITIIRKQIATDLASGAASGSVATRRAAHLEAVVLQFEGFSFYNATKEGAQPKFALLEECLAWMQAK